MALISHAKKYTGNTGQSQSDISCS